jgi:hypothetical protein
MSQIKGIKEIMICTADLKTYKKKDKL